MIEQRKIFAVEGYSSLCGFLVKEMGYSEPTALKRIQVARCAIKYPRIYWYLENNKTSITALSVLAPHLNQSNNQRLLEECSGKSVSKIKEIIVKYYPKAAVEDSVHSRISPINIDQVNITFSASKAFAEKVEKAKAILSHKHPKARLEDIFNDALDALLQKHAPKKARHTKQTSSSPQSRHLPQAIKNEVKEKYEGCCYVSPSGVWCGEKRFPETDHIIPWAMGGKHESRNVRWLCSTHNQLEADKFFGKAWMDQCRGKNRPEQGQLLN